MYGYGNSMFLATHGILARTASGGGIDPDAQAFITAASITDPTQQSAINQLVVDLKGYSIWSKMKALYPMVGGTSTSTSYNLKNPAQFQISWQGGVTSSSNGVQFNGLNSYGITGFVPSSNLTLTSGHLSVYVRTNASDGYDMGSVSPFPYPENMLISRFSDNNFYVKYGSTYLTTNNTDSRGSYITNRNSATNTTGFKNGVRVINAAETARLSTLGLFIGANNNGGTPNGYSPRQLAFASIGDGLTDAEAANFYTAVQAFQVTLGRSIGTQTVSDADAQAFVTNAGIVDQVEANAINNLVIGLKADSLWTKMKAIYPFVGGTSTTNKYNLKNPLDTDAAFRLVFSGGWTFSSTGATPNGTNAYADTKLNDNTEMTLNNAHLSIYSRTNSDGLFCDIGVTQNLPTTESNIFSKYLNVFYPRIQDSNSGIANSVSSLGMFVSNRVNSTQIRAFQNGTLKLITSNSTGVKVNRNFYLSAMSSAASNASLYSNRQLAFASIGDGLSDTEAANFYNRVQTFNTALARQV